MGEADALEQAQNWLSELGVPAPDGSAGPTGQHRADPAVARETGGGSAGELDEARASLAGPAPDPDADPEAVARSVVLRKLSVRAHTRSELERALTARRVPEQAASTVLDRMTELGLVNDEGFARDWVESRQQRRHLSRRVLHQELTRKGVDRETVVAAVQEVDASQELAAARALVEKRTAALARLDPQVRYRRLAGLLSRRGFTSSVVATVLHEFRATRVED